jgi:hypothetical protein
MNRTLTLATLVACLAPATRAADRPADLAAAAKKVLAANCFRCHGENGSAEGKFADVLDRDKLVARKAVIPGNARTSPLVKRTVDGEMPSEKEKPRPSPADLNVLEQWVDAGAPDWGAVPSRRFIPFEEQYKLMMDHKVAAKSPAQGTWHEDYGYVSFAALWNAGASDAELDAARVALVKAINGVSWKPDLVLPTAMDPDKTLYRFTLKDLDWSFPHWQFVTRTPQNMLVKHTTDTGRTELPVPVEAVVANLTRPPIYLLALEMPKGIEELEKKLGVAVANNIRDGKMLRAGFTNSGISRHNRIIERHAGTHGYYWRSYDFGSSRGRKDVLTHPLGPGVSAGFDTFVPDAGEVIFRLPNGLQAFMLVDDKGSRIDRAPTDIVTDPKHPEKVVETGISCLSCHAAGIIDKQDQIRPLLESTAKGKTRDAILAAYRPREDFAEAVAADQASYKTAIEKLGGRVTGTEPINELVRRFDGELDLRRAAAELWATPENFRKALEKSGARALRPLLLPGGTVKRDAFDSLKGSVMRTLHTRLAFHPKDDLPAGRAKTPAGRAVTGREVPAAMIVDHAPLTFRNVSTNRPPTVIDLNAGRFAAADDDGNIVSVYDLETGKRTHQLEKVDRVVRLAFSPDGSRLAVSSYDGFVRLFDPATGKRTAQWVPARSQYTSPSPHYFLTFKGDGSELLTGFWHSGLKALDPATAKVIRESDTYNSAAWYAYGPDGKSLVQAQGSGLALLDLNGKPQDRFGVSFSERGNPSAVRVSPDGKRVCITYLSNHIAVHDLTTRDVVATEQVRVDGLEWYNNHAWTAAYSPDSEHLAVAHEKGVITFWSAKTMRFVGAYKLHADHLRTVQFSKDGKRLATAGLDVRVRVWDVAKLLGAAE